MMSHFYRTDEVIIILIAMELASFFFFFRLLENNIFFFFDKDYEFISTCSDEKDLHEKEHFFKKIQLEQILKIREYKKDTRETGTGCINVLFYAATI